MSTSLNPDVQRLLMDADLCVKCGLCLPHCPTYGASQHEGDSPRGRIALVQGLLAGQVPPSGALQAHLDGCLSCRSCEVVCPARVPFSRILDGGRARLAQLRPRRTWATRALALLLVRRAGRVLLRILLAGAAMLHVPALLCRVRLGRIASFVPAPQRLRPRTALVQGDPLYLFEGCASAVFEPDAVRAVERLLAAAGYAVRPAPAQTCCGALHQHAGLAGPAERLARRNLHAFGAAPVPIATLATGCGAGLRDYAGLSGGEAFAARVHDFAELLAPRLDRLRFRSAPIRVALHTPCTAINVMRSDAALRRLLAAVPGLELLDLDPAQRCCGAAGSHLLTHADAADRLLAPRLSAIERLRPDLVLSANVGCSLHLAAGINRAARAPGRPAIPVRHPAQLLADLLESAPAPAADARLPPRS